MALFDRNDDRGYGYRGDRDRGFVDRAQNAVRRGWDRVENAFEGRDAGDYGVGDEHLRRDYENRSTMDTGTGRGWNAGGYDRPMDREGGLHQRNSWSDGAWTADAAERADREWNARNRGRGYDHDVSPFQAGWRAGGMHGGGMGMNRERGWNLGGEDRDWGHTGNLGGGMNRYDRGWTAGGASRGSFVDRAQNAIRRGWDQVEDRFDRDDDREMRGGSLRRYDRDWHQPSDLRAYRDDEGHYGVEHVGGMRGRDAGMGMSRYGSDFDRGRMDYGRGYKSREQVDAGDPYGDRQSHTPMRMTGSRGIPNRYDNGYGRGRDWF